MNKFAKALCAPSVIALALGLMTAPAQATTVTTSAGPVGIDTCCWAYQNIASITLNGDKIVNLTSGMDIVDQGWGGMDPGFNSVHIALSDGTTNLWDSWVAGGYHWWTHQDFAADAGQLASLNAALNSIDLSTTTATLNMWVLPVGYPGWELHVANASFAVTSQVPEAATWAMMLAGFGAVGFAMRRQKAQVTFA